MQQFLKSFNIAKLAFDVDAIVRASPHYIMDRKFVTADAMLHNPFSSAATVGLGLSQTAPRHKRMLADVSFEHKDHMIKPTSVGETVSVRYDVHSEHSGHSDWPVYNECMCFNSFLVFLLIEMHTVRLV